MSDLKTRRIRYCLGVMILAAIVVIIYWWIYPRFPLGVSERAYNWIRIGMTREEVAFLVGRSPGYVPENPETFEFIRLRRHGRQIAREGATTSERYDFWGNGHFSIIVYLDERGRVVGKELWAEA